MRSDRPFLQLTLVALFLGAPNAVGRASGLSPEQLAALSRWGLDGRGTGPDGARTPVLELDEEAWTDEKAWTGEGGEADAEWAAEPAQVEPIPAMRRHGAMGSNHLGALLSNWFAGGAAHLPSPLPRPVASRTTPIPVLVPVPARVGTCDCD